MHEGEGARMIPSAAIWKSMTAGRSLLGRCTIVLACAALLMPPAMAAVSDYARRPDVLAFVERMHADHGFSAAALRRMFAQVRYQPQVIAAMTRPFVSPPPYDEFAARFLDPARVDAGAEFWRAHASVLDR